MKLTSAEIKTGIAIAPIDSADTSGVFTAGAVIDRKGYESAVFTCLTGIASGSPTAQVVDFAVYESDVSGSGYVAVSGATGAITADSTAAEINLDLRGVKRYVKVYYDVSFTGGSTPKIEVAGSYSLGEAKVAPAA